MNSACCTVESQLVGVLLNDKQSFLRLLILSVSAVGETYRSLLREHGWLYFEYRCVEKLGKARKD
jgi:hypothetical protein